MHCRFGVGRTGTFVTSYLLRKDIALKAASKIIKETRAAPTSYPQWKLLKQYSKKSGPLKSRKPSLNNGNSVDLSPYFARYEALIDEIDRIRHQAAGPDGDSLPACGSDTQGCCFDYLELRLIEAIYLNHRMNRHLESVLRAEVIHDAVEIGRRLTALSAEVFSVFAEEPSRSPDLRFSHVDAISGKYVQDYFAYLIRR